MVFAHVLLQACWSVRGGSCPRGTRTKNCWCSDVWLFIHEAGTSRGGILDLRRFLLGGVLGEGAAVGVAELGGGVG